MRKMWMWMWMWFELHFDPGVYIWAEKNGSRSRGFHLRWHYYSIFASLSSVRSRLRASKEWRERKKHTHTLQIICLLRIRISRVFTLVCLRIHLEKNSKLFGLFGAYTFWCCLIKILGGKYKRQHTHTLRTSINLLSFVYLHCFCRFRASYLSQFLLTWLHFSC